MIYQVDRIVSDVRVALDENGVDNSLFSDGDEETLQLNDIIRSKILESVDRVHSEAPYYLLEQGNNFVGASDAVYWGDQESGWVLVPDDFLRLVVFEMSDWERPVYSLITPEDPSYAKQRSRVKALRGVAQRPVCALAVRPEGKVIEFYSCKSTGATLTRAVYIPQAVIDESGGVNISEECYTSVVYMTAGLSLTALGEVEKGRNMIEIANTYLKK